MSSAKWRPFCLGLSVLMHAQDAIYNVMPGSLEKLFLGFMKIWCFTYMYNHDDVIKWKHFPRYWPFVRGIHMSPVNSPYKGQWRGALMFSLICARINGWVNNHEASDLRRYRAHYDVIVIYAKRRNIVNGPEGTNKAALTHFRPSVAYMREWIESALVQIMAYRLFGTKPLSKPMPGHCL